MNAVLVIFIFAVLYLVTGGILYWLFSTIEKYFTGDDPVISEAGVPSAILWPLSITVAFIFLCLFLIKRIGTHLPIHVHVIKEKEVSNKYSNFKVPVDVYNYKVATQPSPYVVDSAAIINYLETTKWRKVKTSDGMVYTKFIKKRDLVSWNAGEKN